MQPPSLLRPILILASATVILLAMHWAASFIVPVLLAFFFATLLTPLYEWLKRKRVPAGLALLLSGFFMILVAIFLVYLVGNSLTVMVQDLSSYRDQFSQRQADVAAGAEALRQAVDLAPFAAFLSPGTLVDVLSFFLSMMADILKNSFFILLMTMFVLVEGPLFIRRLGQAFGPDHFLPQNLRTLARRMISYFGLRAVVNFVTASATGLMFWFFGIPHAGLWAVLTFFLSFVPYIGAFVAGIPPVLLAYAQGGLALAVTVGVLMVVINTVTENIIAPMIMGKGLSISPTVVFLSFIFWMFILGGSGAFIAMPLTLGILLFLHSFEETRALMETVIIRSEQSQKSIQERLKS